MHKITGVAQHYAWGSPTAIPAILGREASDEPVAEYWLGAHRSAPATLEGDRPLDAHLDEAPHHLGEATRAQFGERLPYLLKILAAESPLSLQAHPTRAQAEEGFARENEAGVALDAPERTYRDDWPKPEAIVALTEFDALCGFRDPAETVRLFHGLGNIPGLDSVIGPLEERRGEAAMAEVFLDILSLDGERRPLVDQVVALAAQHQGDAGELGTFARTAVEIDRDYPGEPSVLAALLLNRVRLQPGEALFLDAGNMHAYLHGTGIEIMANSDNVIRGGLTPKHINVDELVRVVSFAAVDPRPVVTREVAPGIARYLTPAPEFALYALHDLSEAALLPGTGARIVLVVEGSAVVADARGTVELAQGEAAFVGAQETGVTVRCTGRAFVAAPGV